MRNNKYNYGTDCEELFNNGVDNNSVNGISMYPYNNYNSILLEKLELHERQTNNPHKVTADLICAVAFKSDQSQSTDIDDTDRATARKNIGLENIINTSDSDLPIPYPTDGYDKKFTAYGAYLLKNELDDKIARCDALEDRVRSLEDRVAELERIINANNEISE